MDKSDRITCCRIEPLFKEVALHGKNNLVARIGTSVLELRRSVGATAKLSVLLTMHIDISNTYNCCSIFSLLL